MEDFDIPAAGETSTALVTLSALPLDPASPILQHYPAMKLGMRTGIRFCADLLEAGAREVLAREPAAQSWLIVSPPYFVLPGAANLLAREVQQRLSFDAVSPRLAELRLRPAEPQSPLEAAEPKIESSSIYSRSGFQTRMQSRQRLHQRLETPDPAVYQGRTVLFINDINVTGAQQHYMRKALQDAGVTTIHWLYLVQVRPELAQSHPGVEHEINSSRLGSFEEFASVLGGPDIDFTARCINRLFDYEDAQLIPMLRNLDPARKALLLRLAAEEGQCQGRDEDYWDKLRRITGTAT